MICVSEFIAREAVARGCAPDRVVTVHNPVEPAPCGGSDTREELRQSFGLADDDIAVLMAARLEGGKRQLDALEAFACAAVPNTRLFFAGEGPDHDKLTARIAELGSGSTVRLLGFQHGLIEKLRAFDIFIHPSLEEPFGLAVAEASAAGLPVIACASGATPELVEDGVTGLLAAPGDVPGLAMALRCLATYPELRNELGANAALHVAARFDPASRSRKSTSALASLDRTYERSEVVVP
ncbi:MAG: glycosyltransferase family 4 protein [Dehalococcoidia bacterium]|nr:glycosyltransferase family 4 protein [Dehalococcoidia bacterium]